MTRHGDDDRTATAIRAHRLPRCPFPHFRDDTARAAGVASCLMAPTKQFTQAQIQRWLRESWPTERRIFDLEPFFLLGYAVPITESDPAVYVATPDSSNWIEIRREFRRQEPDAWRNLHMVLQDEARTLRISQGDQVAVLAELICDVRLGRTNKAVASAMVLLERPHTNKLAVLAALVGEAF